VLPPAGAGRSAEFCLAARLRGITRTANDLLRTAARGEKEVGFRRASKAYTAWIFAESHRYYGLKDEFTLGSGKLHSAARAREFPIFRMAELNAV
jgi:hypothetical protein